MARAITGKVHHKRAKKVLKQTKGFRGGRSKLYRVAKTALIHSLVYAYVGRKRKKRDTRQLWIARINGTCRNYDITYSRFIDGLKKANVIIDRKTLANLAIEDIKAFEQLIEVAKKALDTKK